MKKIFYKKGFTLVELLVVLALLSVIISGIILLINPAAILGKSNDARRKRDLRQIQTALELYRTDQGAYPITGSSSFPTCDSTLQSGASIYMNKVPCDPLANPAWGRNYFYTSTTGSSYTLWACLENANDPERDTTKENTNCAAANASYTLLSP